jgi:hypothetical protein
MTILTATFYDPSRQRPDTYDFSIFKTSDSIKNDLRDAFVGLTGHYACRSRRQAWRSTKEFASFLESVNVQRVLLAKLVLTDFGLYLNRSSRLRKTNGTHYNFARRVIIWLGEERPKNGWAGQSLTYMNFSRERINSRDNAVSTDLLRAIAESCKAEISDIKKAYSEREAIESSIPLENSQLSSADFQLLKRLMELEKRGLWTQTQLLAAGHHKIVHAAIRRLTKFRELTARDALPILLLMLIESGANPMSIMELNLKCLEPHPTDESMKILYWTKPRATVEQRLQFMTRGNYSMPTLVELAKKMTSSIRGITECADKELLFISRTGDVARRICIQAYHDQLRSFRDKHGLPNFTFSDIRKAVAGLIYASTKSKAAVSDFLQHKNTNTTNLYLDNNLTRQKRYENINDFQGQMVALSKVPDGVAVKDITMLGTICGAPKFKGYKRDVESGICIEFTHCASCVNAIVIKDDPHYIARVLVAKRSLERLKQESHNNSDLIERFQHAYQPTLDVILRQILPNISSLIIKQAESLASKMPELPRIY